jgi:hypothetical protein
MDREYDKVAGPEESAGGKLRISMVQTVVDRAPSLSDPVAYAPDTRPGGATRGARRCLQARPRQQSISSLVCSSICSGRASTAQGRSYMIVEIYPCNIRLLECWINI